MSKYTCECGSTKEFTGTETMRVVNGQVCNFADDGTQVDLCECGKTMERVKTGKGWGGFVSTKGGGTGNFKRS